jgi:hypothetical protein
MFNIWRAKRADIQNGIQQVPLDECDFSESDVSALRNIEQAYPIDYIDSVNVENIKGKAFVVLKSDRIKLTDKVYKTLNEAVFDPELESPVSVSFNEAGEVLFNEEWEIPLI